MVFSKKLKSIAAGTLFFLSLLVTAAHAFGPNLLFCIEKDGCTSIEVSLTGSCSTDPKCNAAESKATFGSHEPDQHGCIDCTDVEITSDLIRTNLTNEHITLDQFSTSVAANVSITFNHHFKQDRFYKNLIESDPKTDHLTHLQSIILII